MRVLHDFDNRIIRMLQTVDTPHRYNESSYGSFETVSDYFDHTSYNR
jgi:hypothetical protein